MRIIKLLSAFAGVAHSKARSTPASHIRRFMALPLFLPADFLLLSLLALPHPFPNSIGTLSPINHACACIPLSPIRSHPSE